MDSLIGGNRIEELTNTTIPGVGGAPDTFRGQTTPLIPRAIYLVSTTDQEDVYADLDSVYAWLEAQPNVDAARTGIAGFCYGGRVSLLYSLRNSRLAATVVFYGSSETDPEVLKSLPGPVLGIFGGADASIPLEDVDALERALQQAGIPHQISIYDGQPHAFVKSAEGIGSDPVQRAAWNEMLEFLEANLKSGSARFPREGGVDYSAPFPWKYYAMLVFEHAFGSGSRH